MGSAQKMFKKIGSAMGAGPNKKTPSKAVKDMAATASGTSAEEMAGKLTAQKAERAAAAKRRGRRMGRRGLMMAGRLGGGGGEQEETKTTLGA